jgi:selenocysteine lyase/cysteine desulfurase
MAAADAHKWLLGPCGAGIMYVRKELQDKLNPPIYGWNNVSCPNFVAQEQIDSTDRAPHNMKQAPTTCWASGRLIAGMELILEIGIENIARELLRKRALLVDAIQAKGYTVVHAGEGPESASGIVSFFKAGMDLAPLHQRLQAEQIFTSLRTDRAGNAYIRLSPHFYISDAELLKVVGLL